MDSYADIKKFIELWEKAMAEAQKVVGKKLDKKLRELIKASKKRRVI